MESVNWAGVITLLCAVVLSHFVLKPYIGIEVVGAFISVMLLYPMLRLKFLPMFKCRSQVSEQDAA